MPFFAAYSDIRSPISILFVSIKQKLCFHFINMFANAQYLNYIYPQYRSSYQYGLIPGYHSHNNIYH